MLCCNVEGSPRGRRNNGGEAGDKERKGVEQKQGGKRGAEEDGGDDVLEETSV